MLEAATDPLAARVPFSTVTEAALLVSAPSRARVPPATVTLSALALPLRVVSPLEVRVPSPRLAFTVAPLRLVLSALTVPSPLRVPVAVRALTLSVPLVLRMPSTFRLAPSAMRSADPRVSSPPAFTSTLPSTDPSRVVVLPLRTTRSPVKVFSPPRMRSPGPVETLPVPLMRPW